MSLGFDILGRPKAICIAECAIQSRAHGVVVAFNVSPVRKLLKDSLVALTPADKKNASLIDLKKEHLSDKTAWEESLRALQERLNETVHRVYELQLDRNTILELPSEHEKTIEAAEKLEKSVQSVEDRISWQCT